MRPELSKAAQLLQSRDAAAVDEALRLLQSTVFNFSMKLCGHREDAEDTMQDVLMKTVTHARSISEPRALAVWLYTVARNRCWMSRRRSKFAPKQTLALDDLMPDATELQSLTTPAQQAPDAQLEKATDAQRLHQAVLRIPPKYRIILVLHDMEELDASEVATVTGLREGTVRVRLHRARLFVRRELANTTTSGKRAPRRAKPAVPALSCRRMFSLLSEYIDGRTDDLTCSRFQQHLSECPACVAFIHDLERAIDRCRHLQAPCASKTADSLRHALVQEYLRVLNHGPKSAKAAAR
jgi:RNA polymerase sigma-70 factor, ECF subfamily